MLNIALFLGELQLDSQSKVLNGIVAAARRDGNNVYVYSLTLTLDDKFNDGEYAVAAMDNFDVYDGFIIYAESIYSKSIRKALVDKIKKTGKPSASVDCYIEGMINVSSDNEGAMRVLAKHLFEEHHVEKVNFIGGPEDSIDAITRKRVVYEEMEAHGIPMEAERYYIGDYYARSGRSAIAYYEEVGKLDADVYICANDQMALGAYYALAARGIRVPDDALMTGYDDIFQAANHYPRITSVKRYEEIIGETAYNNIVKAIRGEEYDTEYTVQSDVVCAESCGCEMGRPISHRIVVDSYVEKSLRETRYAEMASDFSAEVTTVQTYDGMTEKLKKYIPRLGGDAFSVCLLKDEKDITNIKKSIVYVDGKFYDKAEYKNDSMLDAIGDEVGGKLYVVNSIHFNDKCYGYTIIRDSHMPTQSEFYRIFVINLGNTVEHIDNYIKMQEMIKTLDEMWVFDPMTHIYNRAGFFKFADTMKVSAKYSKENLYLIFLDLDGLKKVNDVYGHEMGDKLICEMADILRKCRDKEELLMRYGGDEFVVFGEGYEEEFVKSYVERIRKAMREANSKSDRLYQLDASIGYSMVAYDDERPLSGLIELADQKMYKEKREKHRLNKDK